MNRNATKNLLNAFLRGERIMCRQSHCYGVSGSCFHRRMTDFSNQGYVILSEHISGSRELVYWLHPEQVEAKAPVKIAKAA